MKSLNYLLYRTKYRFGKYIPLKNPVDVSLELSSHCNQWCSYCYHSKENKAELPFKKGFMDLDLAENIIWQAAAMEVPSLKFNYRGESTMHPEFKRITTLARQLAFGFRFQDRLTNSNFKFNPDREDVFEGLCNQTKVKISFDSFIPSVMETQRGGSIHKIALANIDKFYNHPKRKNTEIVIQAVRTELNKDEDIAGESKKRWPEAKISIRDVVAGRTESSANYDALVVKDRHEERQSCIQAHVRMIVHWDGKVGPCCPAIRNDLIIGDATKTGLYEIFNGYQAKALRSDLNSKKAFDSEPCKTCSSFESFKGYKPSWHA